MPRPKASEARARLHERILEAIRESPGISLGELDGLGLSPSGLRHRVERLEASGKVRSTRVGRRRCFFLAEGPHAGVAGQMRALTQGKARRSVALALARLGAASAEAIAADTGLSPRAVYHHAKKLVDGGAAQRLKHGVLGPTDALLAFLQKEDGHGPRPLPEPTQGTRGPSRGPRA